MRAAPLIVAGAIAFGLSSASLVHAGESNTIYIKQESPAGSSTGNSLSIDQSDASNSLVAGPSLRTLLPFAGLSLDSAFQGTQKPALQRGEGNSASITISDIRDENSGNVVSNRGILLLLQDTSPGRALQQPNNGTSNVANATLAGESLGAIIQMGTGNDATLNLNNANGLIGQFGTDLRASLAVTPGGSGQVVQVGNNNDVAVEVSGGGSASYTQIGSNLNTNNQVQIFTNTTGTVNITQTGF